LWALFELLQFSTTTQVPPRLAARRVSAAKHTPAAPHCQRLAAAVCLKVAQNVAQNAAPKPQWPVTKRRGHVATMDREIRMPNFHFGPNQLASSETMRLLLIDSDLCMQALVENSLSLSLSLARQLLLLRFSLLCRPLTRTINFWPNFWLPPNCQTHYLSLTFAQNRRLPIGSTSSLSTAVCLYSCAWIQFCAQFPMSYTATNPQLR